MSSEHIGWGMQPLPVMPDERFVVMTDKRTSSYRMRVSVVHLEEGVLRYPKKPSPQCKGVKAVVWRRNTTSGRIASRNRFVAEQIAERLNANPLAAQAAEATGELRQLCDRWARELGVQGE